MTNDQDPFQVVLIDIQKAEKHEIVCVKKPLTEELKYVAISYRWGELQEFIVDTSVGYLASVTSFDINDFYKLCTQMTKEPTMKSIPYVWVDAICVNQSNLNERKATIYHMTQIYELASWILAVPDLHEAHLKAMHLQVMTYIQYHERYLYHLLHGNTKNLYELDQVFLDKIQVPQNSNLRRLLTTSTDSFADSFITPVKLNPNYNHVFILEHLYDLNTKTASSLQTNQSKDTPDIQHECNEMNCPLQYFNDLSKLPSQKHPVNWARCILERRTEIRQAMRFLTDLVVDWSSRVWVISEFHISKKKNNLKFWFNQLQLYGYSLFISLFTFDMNDPWFTTIQKNTLRRDLMSITSEPVYLGFYQRLIHRLNRQTFLEMMLKSKASKNEDRFYAIFPLFPHYKHLLQKELGNLNTILGIKLKLYQVMTNQDKVLLFYLAAKGITTYVLPTFATSAITWQDDYKEMEATMDITLCQEIFGYYLRVKPTKYVITRDVLCRDAAATKTLERLLYPKTLHQNIYGETLADMLVLFPTRPIVLIGSFDENTWILKKSTVFTGFNPFQDVPDVFPGFRVF